MAEPVDIGDEKTTAGALCCAPAPAPLLDAREAERLAGILKALGHPIRVQMMNILTHLGGHVCVCDIEAHFEVKQPTISHHLRTLKEAGLVDAEQRGLFAYYRVQPEAVALVRQHLDAFGNRSALKLQP